MSSERSPLLPSHISSTSNSSQSSELPALDAVLSEYPPLRYASVTDFQAADIPPGSWSATKTAFWMLLLLSYPTVTPGSVPLNAQSPLSTWGLWNEERGREADQARLEELVTAIWEQVTRPDDEESLEAATEGGDRDWMEEFLWTKVRLRSESTQNVRVGDLLFQGSGGSYLLMQGSIFCAVSRRWLRSGLPSLPPEARRIEVFAQRYLSFSPKTKHALSLVLHITYLVTFTHLLLYPLELNESQNQSHAYIPFRELAVLLYSLAFSISQLPTSSASAVPTFLTVFSMAGAYSFSSDTESPMHILLLLSFSLQLIQLHFPSPSTTFPSPVLLFSTSFESSLPLRISTRLRQFLTKEVIPVVLFCLPFLALVFTIISFSVTEPIQTPWAFLTGGLLDPPQFPTPYTTRLAFLLLGMVALAIFPLTLLALMLPTDEEELELDARRTFLRAVITNERPAYYIPPFNLISSLIESLRAVFTFGKGLWLKRNERRGPDTQTEDERV